MSQNLDQLRAKFALDQYRQLRNIGGDDVAQRFVLKLPTMIRAYGLGQCLAYLHAQDDEPQKTVASRIRDAFKLWLAGNPDPTYPRRLYLGAREEEPLLQCLERENRAQYLLAQREALVLATWFKRMAELPH